jgi:hypothetical protein
MAEFQDLGKGLVCSHRKVAEGQIFTHHLSWSNGIKRFEKRDLQEDFVLLKIIPIGDLAVFFNEAESEFHDRVFSLHQVLDGS